MLSAARQYEKSQRRCRYEQEQRRKGREQKDIRKPRFMSTADNPNYPEGSKSCECALCPMKRGLFKQTVASHPQWVHVVCALWQTPEMVVPQLDQPDIVRFCRTLAWPVRCAVLLPVSTR